MDDPTTDDADAAGYRCEGCGNVHEELPMALALEWPIDVHEIDPEDRDRRVERDGDWCILDGERFFLRGCLEVPLRDRALGPFVWGVWVELEAEDFEQTMDDWEREQRELVPPMLGRLANGLPPYPETRGLAVHVHTRPVGMRPLVELPPTDHPLALEQHGGIDLARVHEILDDCL